MSLRVPDCACCSLNLYTGKYTSLRVLRHIFCSLYYCTDECISPHGTYHTLCSVYLYIFKIPSLMYFFHFTSPFYLVSILLHDISSIIGIYDYGIVSDRGLDDSRV
mmetsp:Transcript_14722/g.2435  ORF Transcript_14722/g.2435 Transcript_14722/m.2435 type:complete len:106 (+) Transcript_14722:1-318(+)